jgi:hypothetical protein
MKDSMVVLMARLRSLSLTMLLRRMRAAASLMRMMLSMCRTATGTPLLTSLSRRSDMYSSATLFWSMLVREGLSARACTMYLRSRSWGMGSRALPSPPTALVPVPPGSSAARPSHTPTSKTPSPTRYTLLSLY